MSGPDVLYVLSHGFTARTVLQSGLKEELDARGVSMAVLSANAGKGHLDALCERRGVRLYDSPDLHTPVLAHYAAARRYLFEDYERNAALVSKHKWELAAASGKQIVRARPLLGKAVNTITLRSPALRSALSQAEQVLLRSRALERLLREVRPRLLVSTYPVNWVEALAILEAKRLGIPTVGQLLSWDNITCKGRFPAVPDHFISWGPIMTEEIEEHYSVPRAQVVEAGVAHFDLHARPVDRDTLAGHLHALGLDPAKPYLFVGMSAAFFAPHEVDIVAWLAARVRAGAFGPDIQLLARPHPQAVRGSMADPKVVEKLLGVVGPRVAVDMPGVLSDDLDMDDHDMLRLAALLHGATVTLNSGSTLCIDALLHDRPVVVTFFDGEASLPWFKSARRIEDFPHIQKLLRYGGIAVTRSFEALERAVAGYVADPSRDASARRAALKAECGTFDGHACARIADGVAGFLRARQSPMSSEK